MLAPILAAARMEEIERVLLRWGHWMRRDDHGLGHAPCVAWAKGYCAPWRTFEDWAREVEDGLEEKVDAAIRDLTAQQPQHRLVLFAVYANPKGFRILGEDVDVMMVDALLTQAHDALRPFLRRHEVEV